MKLWKQSGGAKGSHSFAAMSRLHRLRHFATALLFTTLTVGLFASPASAVTTGTRASAFEYDAVSGLITKEIIEPDDPNLCLVTSYTYDSFGNKISATTRNCNGSTGANAPTNTEAAAPTTATQAGTDAIIVARTSSTTYDTQGRFPVSSTNALSHTETKTFNADYGTVATLTGPNNLTTSWTYDSFGRPLTESRADGTSSATAYALCDVSCPANGSYTITKSQPGAPTGKTTYDMQGRAIQTESPDKDGTLVYARTQYDKLGRTAQSSRPYKAGATPVWTTVTYDTIGRPLSTTAPDTSVTSAAYAGYTTVTTNAKSQTKTEIKNSQGQLVIVADTQSKNLTYQYDPFGNLTTTTDALGNITTITYDKRGRKTAMNDPDQGAWSYSYDALGQLKRQTDAKLQVVTFTYDKLGRMSNRSEPDLISNWTYDTCDATLNPAGKCIGKPVKETSDNNYARTYLYDAYGRATAELDNVDTGYGVTKSFDSYGRVSTLAYPNNFSTQNVYSANGYLIEVRNTATNALYWQANTTDNEGRINKFTYGNNIATNMGYDSMGRLNTISAGGGAGVDQTLGNTSMAGAASVTNQSFVFDTLGNLTQRYDQVTNLNEAFGYDSLNRVTSTSAQAGAGPLTQTTLTYNAIGNIITKSDVGTYTYGSSKPHAVTQIMMNDGVTVYGAYSYDANGNMLTGIGRTATWSSWNMATSVVGTKAATSTAGLSASTPIGTSSSTFAVVYNSAHERVKETLPDGTIVYNISPRVDTGINVEKRVKTDGTIMYVNSLYAGSMPFGTVTVTTPPGGTATTQTSYFHTDHLGSIIAISDQAGNVTQRRSYDAWGKKRNLNGTSFANAFVTPNERHGYSGHEEWDEVGLINMNGRLYDPAIGRFMSADPTVQFPDDMQSYNRYSYVNNNPLSFVDKSGYGLFGSLFRSIKHAISGVFNGVKHLLQNKVVRLIATVVAAYYGGELFGNLFYSSGLADGLSGLSTLAYNAVYGAVVGAGAGFAGGFVASGGNIKAALSGAVAGAIGGGVMGYYGSSYPFSRVIASSVANGVSAKIQGGNFIDGLKSGLVTSFAAFGLDGATKYTDGLKRLACSQPDAKPCVYNRWGELLTDGGRDVDYKTYNPSEAGNYFTLSGMAAEGSAAHYYNENGYIGRFVNFVSKVHDFQNSWDYSSTTGFYMSRGEAFDTIFQAYSFSGMLPAASFTGAALLDGRPYITGKIR